MKTRIYIVFLLCLFQIVTYAQKTAQVTLSIRLYPIQTIEVKDSEALNIEVYNENIKGNQGQKTYGSQKLSTFSTSKHSTRVDSVKCKGFEALRTVRDLPLHADKSINHIFSDQSNYYKNGDEHNDGLNLVYSMETL